MGETDAYLAYCLDEACMVALSQWLAVQEPPAVAIPTGARPAQKVIDGVPIGTFYREN